MAAKSLIVIPCYNEESRLPFNELGRFLEKHPNFYLLFSDDGSKDRTYEVCCGFKDSNAPGRVFVYRLPKNQGKAEAVRHGVLEGLHLVEELQYIGYWDADGSTPIEEMHRFVEVVESKPEVEAVLGSRIRILGKDIRRSHSRHYVSRVFATLASLILEIPVYDTQCGAKIFSVKLAQLAFKNPFKSNWLFDVELIQRLILNAYLQCGSMQRAATMFYELPLAQWHAKAGSKIKPWDFIKAVWELFGIFLLKRKLYGRFFVGSRPATSQQIQRQAGQLNS